MRKYFGIVIFWGALWGLVEATLGYFLHLLPVSIGWVIWFPMALYFTSMVYRRTGKYNSIIFTSCIAASIKLVNLLMPVRIDKVINPAASILLEGLAVFAICKLLESNRKLTGHKFLEALALSASWRLMYVLYILPMPYWMVKISPVSALMPFTKFLILESLVNGITIYLCVLIAPKVLAVIKDGNSYFNRIFPKLNPGLNLVKPLQSLEPFVPYSLLAIAILIQWAL